MDVITIAAAITATKTLVKSAKGVQDIAHGLDGLFQAKEQHEKNKNHKSGSSIGEKNKSILQKRAKDDGSETSMSSAAAVIEKKQLDQQLNDLKDEINRKWPTKVGEKTTWDLILEERKKRIADKKEREKQEKIEAEERARHRKAILFEIGKGLAVLIIASGIGWFLYWAATSGPAVR
jgi:hypothetical protein